MEAIIVDENTTSCFCGWSHERMWHYIYTALYFTTMLNAISLIFDLNGTKKQNILLSGSSCWILNECVIYSCHRIIHPTSRQNRNLNLPVVNVRNLEDVLETHFETDELIINLNLILHKMSQWTEKWPFNSYSLLERFVNIYIVEYVHL